MEKVSKEELITMLLANIISADNDEFTEEQKQQVINRYEEKPEDLAYVLEPAVGPDLAKNFVKALEEDKK